MTEKDETHGGLDKLAEALSKAQSQYLQLSKSKTANIRMKAGGTYSYKYSDLSDLIDATRAALSANGLAVSQLLQGDQLVTKLIHKSGQFLRSSFRINVNLPPQEFGSALTYYRRYTLGPLLGIAAEEDDDGKAGNESDKEQKEKEKNAASAKAAAERSQKRESTDKREAPAGPGRLTYAQIRRLYAIANEHGWETERIKFYLQSEYKVASTTEIKVSDYDKICAHFSSPPGGHGAMDESPLDDGPPFPPSEL